MCKILTRNDKDRGDDKSGKTGSGADDEVAVAVGAGKGHEVVGTDNAFLNVLNVFIRSFEAAAKLLLNLK
jgi:hypothetical protein